MMHQDHRELPEYLQREIAPIIRRERRQRIFAGICASLILGGIVITLSALAMLSAELVQMERAADETPIAP